MVKSFTEVGFKPEVRTLASFQDDYGLEALDDEGDEADDDDEDGEDDEDDEMDEDEGADEEAAK